MVFGTAPEARRMEATFRASIARAAAAWQLDSALRLLGNGVGACRLRRHRAAAGTTSISK